MSDRVDFLEITEEQLKQLRLSYGRCCLADEFLDTFYDQFLESFPEVARLLAKTGMTNQKKMLHTAWR